MRFVLAILVLFLCQALAADDGQPASDSAGTIQQGLAFLAKDALAWKNEHQCVSCHHAALVVWSMREAKQRGHTIDELLLAELTRWVAESGDGTTGLCGRRASPRR